MTAGLPDAAARLVAATGRVGARALEIAIADDPTFRDRHDDLALRRLLRDTEIYIDRLAKSLAERGSQLRPRVGRPGRPGLSTARGLDGRHGPALRGAPARGQGRPRAGRATTVDQALDEAIASFRRFRRIAGDARPKNRLLQFLYKGA